MNRSKIITLVALVCAAACSPKEQGLLSVGSEPVTLTGLFAPWDGIEDNTIFTCSADSARFYFSYEVVDSTITLVEPFTGELDVNPEDRVEIFFSTSLEMDPYFCLEIDPMGRVMDYSCRYYRQYDYDWDMPSLEVASDFTDDGYEITGSLSKAVLQELGINLDNFYMGIFRADFHHDRPENWLSRLAPYRESPDFHIPEVLFPAKIK